MTRKYVYAVYVLLWHSNTTARLFNFYIQVWYDNITDGVVTSRQATHKL